MEAKSTWCSSKVTSGGSVHSFKLWPYSMLPRLFKALTLIGHSLKAPDFIWALWLRRDFLTRRRRAENHLHWLPLPGFPWPVRDCQPGESTLASPAGEDKERQRGRKLLFFPPCGLGRFRPQVRFQPRDPCCVILSLPPYFLPILTIICSTKSKMPPKYRILTLIPWETHHLSAIGNKYI